MLSKTETQPGRDCTNRMGWRGKTGVLESFDAFSGERLMLKKNGRRTCYFRSPRRESEWLSAPNPFCGGYTQCILLFRSFRCTGMVLPASRRYAAMLVWCWGYALARSRNSGCGTLWAFRQRQFALARNASRRTQLYAPCPFRSSQQTACTLRLRRNRPDSASVSDSACWKIKRFFSTIA